MPATMVSSLAFVPLSVLLGCNGVVGRMVGLVVRIRRLTLSGMNLMIDSTLGREVGVELMNCVRMVAFDR